MHESYYVAGVVHAAAWLPTWTQHHAAELFVWACIRLQVERM